jgi:hypothetical protein
MIAAVLVFANGTSADAAQAQAQAPAQAAAAPATGDCATSKKVDAQVTGSGPHQVVIEYNCSPGISTGTIYRPADMKGKDKYPILVWGEGGCSQDGLSNKAAMSEIASHGYFVVADGTPTPEGRGKSPGMGNGDMTAQGKPLIGYIDWAIAENSKPASPYYKSLDTTKIAANGFSCGGLMSIGAVGDKRITTWGVTSSGMKRVNEDFYKLVHTPVLFIEGGTGDVAYEGGQMGYAAISKLGVPVMWFDKALGHGGDLAKANGGDFTKIHLAWLNWQLKGDTSATGKGMLVGAGCAYCKDSSWDVKSANIK